MEADMLRDAADKILSKMGEGQPLTSALNAATGLCSSC